MLYTPRTIGGKSSSEATLAAHATAARNEVCNGQHANGSGVCQRSR